MIGVAIPAHNEEEHLAKCLRAVGLAARHAQLGGEHVCVVVVADSCTDTTHAIAQEFECDLVPLQVRNVGAARSKGAELLLQRGARWLAFTDADSEVADDWLVQQLALNADAVCGTVEVVDWTPHGVNAELIARHFRETYFDTENHTHIHGANLGVSATAYRGAGGFQALACSEDVALVEALRANGASIAWSSRPRVVTSARAVGRTEGGFASALSSAVAQRLAQALADPSPSLGVS